MKKINFAKSFGTNINGAEVPKNAIYGKIGHIYYYIADKGKQSLANDSLYVEIYTMYEKGHRFKRTMATKDKPLFEFVKPIAERNNWLDTSVPCEFSLGIRRANVTPAFATSSISDHRRKALPTHYKFN